MQKYIFDSFHISVAFLQKLKYIQLLTVPPCLFHKLYIFSLYFSFSQDEWSTGHNNESIKFHFEAMTKW